MLRKHFVGLTLTKLFNEIADRDVVFININTMRAGLTIRSRHI